jgi:hypothetical protein
VRAVALALLVGACGGGPFEGASALPANELPSGRVVAELRPAQCVDRSGKAVARPATQIRVLVREDDKPLLIEQRPGYDALVVHNAFADGTSLVFQAISEPSDGEPALHEYRVEWPAARAGSLSSARAFSASFRAGGAFTAKAERLTLRCKLVSMEPTG